MFWRRKREVSTTDQAVSAVDRVLTDVAELHEERRLALSSFRDTADWLAELNTDLGEKAALCGSLIAQLKSAQDDISQQVNDNEKVRGKILELIGE